MATAKFFIHSDLKIFLADESENEFVSMDFRGHETIKHLIESLGIPHPEVDVILVNGVSVDFNWHPMNGDKIFVFPKIDNWSSLEVNRLQPDINGKPTFALDGHLGKLAGYLRLLGFDTKYKNEIKDDELAEISSKENRILLTRDRGLLKRTIVKSGYYVRSIKPRKQTKEVLEKFSLEKYAEPFSRCVNCNGCLVPVSKDQVYTRLEPKTKQFYDDFRICRECQQIYWKGSHFKKMEQFIEGLLGDEGI